MLNIQEMAILLGCSENRLLRCTKEYIGKIESLGYEKLGKGKSMCFVEKESSVEREEYLKLLELVDGEETTLNNFLDIVEEVIDMAGLKSDIGELAERLGWSETKTRMYVGALEEAKIIQKIEPVYYGIEYNGNKVELKREEYEHINNQIMIAIDGAKNPSFVRGMVLGAHGFKDIKRLHGWTFSDEAIQCEEFMVSLLLALEYRKKIRK